MGFLDKAKAAATDLAAKADTAINQATAGGGQAETDRYLHDLGVAAYAEHTGSAVDREAHPRAERTGRDAKSRPHRHTEHVAGTAPGPWHGWPSPRTRHISSPTATGRNSPTPATGAGFCSYTPTDESGPTSAAATTHLSPTSLEAPALAVAPKGRLQRAAQGSSYWSGLP
ncbi:MAG: hypothetical protein WA991_01575 [Ornithinimicrobium sp.]